MSFFTVRVMAYICAGLGIAVVVLLGVLYAAGVRIDDVKNQRDAQALKVQEAQTTIKGQIALLGQCDAATKALKAEGDKRQAEADAALAKARGEAKGHQEVNRRLEAKLRGSTPSGADCRTALREIRQK